MCVCVCVCVCVCYSMCRSIPRFNAVIPFLIVIVVTFVGMILSGYFTIINKNNQAEDEGDR